MRNQPPRPHTSNQPMTEIDPDSDYTYFSKPGSWVNDQLFTTAQSNDKGYFLQNSLEESLRKGSFSPAGAPYINSKTTTNLEMKEILKIWESLSK